jgi:dTDP-4-amino-4,6-dideoxygalactose transaminase
VADSMSELMPYSRPYWTEQEVEAVNDVIRSGMWTGGKHTARFERGLQETTGAAHVVCVSSGTTAIHCLLRLLKRSGVRGILITSALNFVAGPAIAQQLGYDVAFTDIDPLTLNMAPESLRAVLESRAERYEQVVVMPVHFAGFSADMDAIVESAARHDAVVIEDACHALPAEYRLGGPLVGSHPASAGAVFSFHSAKPVAAGEGGAVALADDDLADRIRRYRSHNMDKDPNRVSGVVDSNGLPRPWYYEVAEAGHNFRMSEFNAAIGLVQLNRLTESLAHRRRLADRYRAELNGIPGLRHVPADDRGTSALHLFPISFDLDFLGLAKSEVFARYREAGIGVQVHYTPPPEQPAFADERWPRRFPGLDSVSPGLLSLPLFMGMTDADQDRVLAVTAGLLRGR